MHCFIILLSGGIEKLVALLLSSDIEHVLVNVVNALRVLAERSPENQTAIGRENAIPTLIELLGKMLSVQFNFMFRNSLRYLIK